MAHLHTLIVTSISPNILSRWYMGLPKFLMRMMVEQFPFPGALYQFKIKIRGVKCVPFDLL